MPGRTTSQVMVNTARQMPGTLTRDALRNNRLPYGKRHKADVISAPGGCARAAAGALP